MANSVACCAIADAVMASEPPTVPPAIPVEALRLVVPQTYVSSNQLHRTLGVTLKTAWFMSMRLRDAMRVLKIDPIGGPGKFVEADETFVGGKARNRAYGSRRPRKQ